MKLHLVILLCFASFLGLFHVSCTSTEMDSAKQLAIQIGKDVAREAGIAAAETSVQLAKLKLAEAKAKLDLLQGQLDPTDVNAGLKLQAQQAVVKQAASIVAQLEAQLPKLRGLDTVPVETVQVAEPVPAPAK